jgi:ATP-binding cassette subfamily B protein
LLFALLQYFRPWRLRLIPIVLASLLEMFFNAQIPLSVKFMIDRALLNHNQHMMLLILGALATSTVIVSLTSMARDYLYAKIVAQIIAGLRLRTFEHLQRLSMDFYARTETGDVMSRFSNDLGALENGLAAGVAWGLQPFLDLLLSVILVFTLEWRLALIGVLLCPLCILGPGFFSKRATAASVAKQEQESGALTALQESLMAPAVVRAFSLQDTLIGRFRNRNSMLFGASLRLGFVTAMVERSASLGTLFLQVVVMAISGWLAFRGTISIGTFASFQALFVSLSYAFMYLAQYAPNLVSARGGAIRLEELLAEQPDITDVPSAAELTTFRDAIELREVHFSYTGERTNLEDVTLRIPRGSSVAMVGSSGSGKSTVLNLLLRFYNPDRGGAFFDGNDLRSIRMHSLHALCGVVFQESFLFNTTIRENIALAKSGATDAEIIQAAKAAEIHEFITSLPAGYDSLAGERGRNFSGGQRQRIAIARALLRNPSILLLDEATSALDPSTEQAINATLNRIAPGRTMISVTHRLRSVVHVDCIFVFHQGRLAEQGCHAELLHLNGLYAKMWRKQAGVQLNDDADRATVDAAWLNELPLMRGVRLDTLEQVARWFGTEQFSEHIEIVRQGDPGDRFFILVRGKVEVSRTTDDATEIVAILHDGDYFGEMALLSNQPRNATVRTLTPCVCLTLPRDLFNRLLATEPELRDYIRKVATERGAE